MTSQAALTGSPRVSATTANEIAPSTATPAHNSFACNVMATPFRSVTRQRDATANPHRGPILVTSSHWDGVANGALIEITEKPALSIRTKVKRYNNPVDLAAIGICDQPPVLTDDDEQKLMQGSARHRMRINPPGGNT